MIADLLNCFSSVSVNHYYVTNSSNEITSSRSWIPDKYCREASKSLSPDFQIFWSNSFSMSGASERPSSAGWAWWARLTVLYVTCVVQKMILKLWLNLLLDFFRFFYSFRLIADRWYARQFFLQLFWARKPLLCFTGHMISMKWGCATS